MRDVPEHPEAVFLAREVKNIDRIEPAVTDWRVGIDHEVPVDPVLVIVEAGPDAGDDTAPPAVLSLLHRNLFVAEVAAAARDLHLLRLRGVVAEAHVAVVENFDGGLSLLEPDLSHPACDPFSVRVQREVHLEILVRLVETEYGRGGYRVSVIILYHTFASFLYSFGKRGSLHIFSPLYDILFRYIRQQKPFSKM